MDGAWVKDVKSDSLDALLKRIDPDLHAQCRHLILDPDSVQLKGRMNAAGNSEIWDASWAGLRGDTEVVAKRLPVAAPHEVKQLARELLALATVTEVWPHACRDMRVSRCARVHVFCVALACCKHSHACSKGCVAISRVTEGGFPRPPPCCAKSNRAWERGRPTLHIPSLPPTCVPAVWHGQLHALRVCAVIAFDFGAWMSMLDRPSHLPLLCTDVQFPAFAVAKHTLLKSAVPT
eukprot:74497-Chlamydomonas_euryale.AAC.2